MQCLLSICTCREEHQGRSHRSLAVLPAGLLHLDLYSDVPRRLQERAKSRKGTKLHRRLPAHYPVSEWRVQGGRTHFHQTNIPAPSPQARSDWDPYDERVSTVQAVIAWAMRGVSPVIPTGTQRAEACPRARVRTRQRRAFEPLGMCPTHEFDVSLSSCAGERYVVNRVCLRERSRV